MGASNTGKPWSEILGGAGASADAGACFSPLQLEVPASHGCRCETYQADFTGIGRAYCLDGNAVYCPNHLGRWILGSDGPCSPRGGRISLDVCTDSLGGGAVARGCACPSGFAVEHDFTSAPDTDADAGTAADAIFDCCYPIRVTAQNCTQAGFEVQESRGGEDVLQTACSRGYSVRAFVGESGTRVCCQRN